jgi:2,3-bisphosphoglycerate-independent phosphoglycerate mutase
MTAPPRPFVLVIVDGWGYSPDSFGNAIAAARTPHWDGFLQSSRHTLVAASGEAVGLPDGQQGNSEVGHLTIGTGRVVYQPLTKISRAVRDGSIFDNPALNQAVGAALERGAGWGPQPPGPRGRDLRAGQAAGARPGLRPRLHRRS